MILDVLSWMAIVILSISYWFQIWKIHIHKEVRDLSIWYNILLALGFGILGFTAYQEKSLIFLVKQIVTTIPVIVIIFQIIYHSQDRWHELGAKHCQGCKEELESWWKHCPSCGTAKKNSKSS